MIGGKLDLWRAVRKVKRYLRFIEPKVCLRDT